MDHQQAGLPYRIAFLTPEYVTDYADGGGLANYLHRMATSLRDEGHEVEIFLASDLEPRLFVHEGIRIERVPPFARKGIERMLQRAASFLRLGYPLATFLRARKLSAALERRHKEAPFAIVQSADYLAVGLCVRKRKGRVHLTRCSSAAELCNRIEGHSGREGLWRERLERRAIRHAERAYAPSRFVADHYLHQQGISAAVVRPPMKLEVAVSNEIVEGLPERFLVHFGLLNRVKGTEWLCESLRLAFTMAPSLRMVWVGRGDFDQLASWLRKLGPHRSKVQVLFPLPKPQLYALLQRAEAAALPSLADNLPNTVSESLMLGLPVIGTRGASIDELVEEGVTGELVPAEDTAALAEAIVKVWNGRSAVRKGFKWRGRIVDEMQPATAVKAFLQFALEPTGESADGAGAASIGIGAQTAVVGGQATPAMQRASRQLSTPT